MRERESHDAVDECLAVRVLVRRLDLLHERLAAAGLREAKRYNNLRQRTSVRLDLSHSIICYIQLQYPRRANSQKPKQP